MRTEIERRFPIRAAVIHEIGCKLALTRYSLIDQIRSVIPVRHRIFILLSSTSMYVYAIAVLLFVLNLPNIGMSPTLRREVNRVEPEQMRLPPGIEPSELLGLTIVSAGGERIKTWPHWSSWLRSLEAAEFAPGSFDSPTDKFLDDGGARWVRVELFGKTEAVSVYCRVEPTSTRVLLPSLLWLALETGLFLLAALVYWNRPNDSAARLFFVQSLVVIGAYMGGYHWSRITSQPLLTGGYIICGVLLPAVILHFFLRVPSARPVLTRWPRATLTAVYGLPIVFVFLMLSGYGLIRVLSRGAGSVEQVNAALELLRGWIMAYLALAGCWYVASVVALVMAYVYARDASERNQGRWMLIGSFTALLPICYSWYLANWHPVEFGAGAAIWPMFAASACFKLAFAVGITRYRLMQLDQLLSSGLAYIVVSGLAAVIYCALVFAGMLLFNTRGPSLDQAAWVSGSALVLSISLDLARSRLRNYLDRRYRRDKTQLDHILARLGEAVEQLVDTPTLASRLLQVSGELLGYARGSVFIWNDAERQFNLAGTLGFDRSSKHLSPDGPLAQLLAERPVLERTSLPPLHAARIEMFSNAGDVAVALTHETKPIGILLLARAPGAPVAQDGPRLLELFAPIASLALAGAEVRSSVESLNRELQTKVEKISEQQRRILSLQQQLISQARRRPPSEREDSIPEPLETTPAISSVIGSSPALKAVLEMVPKVAANFSAVLVRGESGTGKELIAKALHDLSPRATGPFVKVHCAALAASLLESELFGHVKGAFTGATRDKPGRFEAAHGGTLFLDEIGDISPEVQTKLLRVLQEKTFERVGSNEPIRVDVRLVTATHQDLERLIREGRFRADLYYRLNVITLQTPPLRERGDDAIELAHYFLRMHADRCQKSVESFDDDTLLAIRHYHWPGNIRELENAIERAVIVAGGPTITLADLPSEIRPHRGERRETAVSAESSRRNSTRSVRAARERDELLQALRHSGWNRTEAARQLGLARSTLLARIKKYGLGDHVNGESD